MEKIIEFVSQPWNWYTSGISIALIMFLLLWSGGRFGVSSSLKTICTIGGAGKKIAFFAGDWKAQAWNLVFVGGAIVGGYLATNYLSDGNAIAISQQTINDLGALGIVFDGQLAPNSIFSWENFLSWKSFALMMGGGFLVGFGTRWADGCTSGHAISGLSNLQLPSFIAVIGFFIGGLLMTHVLFPLIF